MSIKAVAFDLDGLMFNTEDLYDIVAKRFLTRRGHQLDSQLTRQMMGRPAKVAVPLMISWYGLQESFDEIMQESDAIFDEILPELLEPMPGLISLLEFLAEKKISTSITTSSRLEFLNKLLQISELLHDFDFFLTSESIKNGKPHPEIYLTAASKFQVDPRHMVVFEDSEIGCEAAVSSGSYAVAVPTAKSRDHRFEGAKMVCESLEDVRILSLFDVN